MTHSKSIILSFVFWGLTGCLGQEKQQPIEQNCSSSYVNDYNQVVFAVQEAEPLWTSQRQMMSRRSVQASLKVYRACEKFYANNNGVSCYARVQSKETLLSGNDLNPYCNTAQAIVMGDLPGAIANDPSMSKPFTTEPDVVIDDEVMVVPQPQEPNDIDIIIDDLIDSDDDLSPLPSLPSLPSPVDNDTEVPLSPTVDDQALMIDLSTSNLRLIILDVQPAQDMIRDRNRIAVEGLVSSFEDETVSQKIMNGSTFCSLTTLRSERESWLNQMERNLSLEVVRISEDTPTEGFQQVTVNLESTRTGLSLACLKRGEEAIKVGDLREALSGIIEIE